jgi:hypothetical protein
MPQLSKHFIGIFDPMVFTPYGDFEQEIPNPPTPAVMQSKKDYIREVFKRYARHKDFRILLHLFQELTRPGATDREATILYIGVCCLEDGSVAYSLHDLMRLLNLGKSSINSLFVQLGYTQKAPPGWQDYFRAALPKSTLINLRKWACRVEKPKQGMPRKDDDTAAPTPTAPAFDVEQNWDDTDCDAFWDAVQRLDSADLN